MNDLTAILYKTQKSYATMLVVVGFFIFTDKMLNLCKIGHYYRLHSLKRHFVAYIKDSFSYYKDKRIIRL